MEITPKTLIVSGMGGDRVRRVGQELMKALGRSGLQAWGRSYRRDNHGVSRFPISFGVRERAMISNACVLQIDLDAGTLSYNGHTHPVPVERILNGNDRESLFAGAATGVLGLNADRCWPNHPDGRDGHAYTLNNMPSAGVDFPVNALGESVGLVLLNGRSAVAAGAVSAGCRYAVVSARSHSHLRALAKTRTGLEFDRVADGESAVYRAAAAGHCGLRALAMVDEQGHRRSEESLSWAARAEIPLVVCVDDANESAFARVLALAGRAAAGCVIAPTSLLDLYHALGEAFDLAERFQMPVTILADRLLTERWELLERPVDTQHGDRGLWAVPPTGGFVFERYRLTDDGISARSVPGQKGLTFTADARNRFEKLERKAKRLRRETPPMRPGDAKTLVLTWGGAGRSVSEIVESLCDENGDSIRHIPVRSVMPFLSLGEYAFLRSGKRVIAVESTPGRPLTAWLRAAAGVDNVSTVHLDQPLNAERVGQALQEACRE